MAAHPARPGHLRNEPGPGQPGRVPAIARDRARLQAQIDATEWLSIKVTPSLGGSGFITRVEFETKTEAVEAEREDEKDPDASKQSVIVQ